MKHHSRTTAVLFDIDGTLIDSNYLQVQAWSEAFDAVGQPVDDARIHRAIALDSSKLLDTLLGDRATELGDDAKARHRTAYQALSGRLRPFSGARNLLAAVAAHRVAVVLATSAPEDELKLLRTALDAEQYLTAVTSAEDAETAKPDPDILQTALGKVGAAAGDAVMVGDTVWDGQAAARAGVAFVGLRSGGMAEAELRTAGAAAVYDDPAHLLANVDSSPLASLWATTN
ncbi:haloacid dehalogenase superfamily, subfamily IA, variant 3 with third motif having DD or ED/haloacid dehalogenase superfamily, subfamily IA, variant 1 with third motif having Dx(3-4)D or Dx(3-4)E [Nakamurella panacisegetis]|uniref:Haloacid dehalogenase superfamily, subfamily IA, variant 3 with third motif having DD or ED/haloacid dehalogenase superfamily, subfamily IA, variant 1 with third motif having Dx(3-4)D or Dx(3-4)E n=1 Tax=Nakamurella panacisegetis TaxID=1090615 RepID=A0A1H0QN49_9ACTN|nr:HAD family hydrolase [Nakamurella panacisegetis]SDP18757.1 haloacid dehalogenase superfamily, subfamily IA, variant 3 with third motif having DD or ED/haloacid dehalogenase superfamily, subfamily IA, variant 1 with third motif having Dx(3-4)D or Dx(3-4)E [Nakamurella panacisegetis]